ncbi:MAG: hypothetical protein WCD18_22110 [Thermosynechococcaceae cyanobacterium]
MKPLNLLQFLPFWAGTSLLFGIGCGQAVFAQSPTLHLQTSPPLQQVIPTHEPVQVSLQALDGTGRSLSNTRIRLQLLTPAPSPWLSTDFPWVEGTTLIELETLAPKGQLTFSQTLPIRGSYRLKADVAPTGEATFAPFSQTLTLDVPENPIKYRNVALLLAILLLTGCAGGWAMGTRAQRQDGEIAPQRVRLMLSGATLMAIAALLYVNISAEMASHHDHSPMEMEDHHAHQSAPTPATQTVNGIRASLSGEQFAKVGQLAEQRLRIADAVSGRGVSNVAVTLRAIGLEHNEEIFAYSTQPNAQGEVVWSQQFFDGAPHIVEAEIAPLPGATQSFKPFKVAQQIDVEALEPPLTTRLITLGYFTAFFVAGLGLGLKLRQGNSRSMLSAKL